MPQYVGFVGFERPSATESSNQMSIVADSVTRISRLFSVLELIVVFRQG